MNTDDRSRRQISREAGACVKGVARGIVTQNKDPDGLCRVKVRFPWYDKPRNSYWARLATPMAGSDRGLVLIPEVGDEVLVAFEREDMRFPYILGALWNSQDKPPLANNGKNNKRIFQSRKKHYLLFDDGARGVVELLHEKKRKITIDDAGILVQDENGNKIQIDSASGALTIHANGALNINAATITIESTGTMELKAGATMTVRGALVNIN